MMRYFADSRDVRPGQPCNPEQFANLQEETMRRIVPGSGVTRTQFGENMIIRSQAAGGSGGIARGAAFASLNTDGDTMEVYMWNGVDWASTATTVYKPYILRYSYWNGATIPYADGTIRTYDATDLDKAYQRRATWVVGDDTFEEVQEITAPYGVGEPLKIVVDMDGNMMDDNNAGRSWGVNEDYT